MGFQSVGAPLKAVRKNLTFFLAWWQRFEKMADCDSAEFSCPGKRVKKNRETLVYINSMFN